MARPHRRSLAIVLTAVLAAIVPCVFASPASAVIGPSQIDAFLLGHGSPLAGEGRTFCEAGRRNGVDPAFLVAISGAESSFGQYLFSSGPGTATCNAFNWFYAPTRAGSAFTSWDQAIETVAAGLRGPLYYGAGRYAVGAIAPVYCPQGTQAWISNVTTYMLELGADPADTRWPAASAGPGVPRVAGLRLRTGARVSALVVGRPIALTPATVVAGARLRIRFTLTDRGPRAGRWAAVVLRLEGPAGRSLAFGRTTTLRLASGASYAFRAATRLPVPGVWRGWVDVQAEDGAILTTARPALRIVVRPPAGPRPSVVPQGRGRDRRLPA